MHVAVLFWPCNYLSPNVLEEVFVSFVKDDHFPILVIGTRKNKTDARTRREKIYFSVFFFFRNKDNALKPVDVIRI